MSSYNAARAARSKNKRIRLKGVLAGGWRGFLVTVFSRSRERGWQVIRKRRNRLRIATSTTGGASQP